MPKCENPGCGKDIIAVNALSMRIPEVDDKIHFFCNAKCSLEANEVWERMKRASEPTDSDT